MASPPLELHGFGVDQPTKPDSHALHTDPISTRLEAGFAVTKRQTLVHSHYTFWPRQANPHRLAVPARLAFARTACHPHRRYPDQAALRLLPEPLRRPGGKGLTPLLDHSAPTWRTTPARRKPTQPSGSRWHASIPGLPAPTARSAARPQWTHPDACPHRPPPALTSYAASR